METTLNVLLVEKKRNGKQVECIDSAKSIFDCAVQLSAVGVGALLVIDDGQLVGIVSERDILNKVVASNKNPHNVTVSSVMTKNLVTVMPTTTTTEAMRIVTERRVRHLPVLENNQLQGVISIGDLTKWMMLQQEDEIHNLTSYIMG